MEPHFWNEKTCTTRYTKSLMHDNINKFCLLDSDKDMYQISSFYSVPKLKYRPTTLITNTEYKFTQA